MQRTSLFFALIIPFFLGIEATRVAFWVARTLDDPEDDDGPILRILCVRVLRLLCAFVPGPLWTLGAWVVWAVGVPVRVALWLWGVGRGHVEIKRHSEAVKKWYVETRARRAELARPRDKSPYA